MIRSIVAIGGRGGNPARVETKIDPTKLDQGMTVAITSIAYGTILNIHDENNKIYFTLLSFPLSDLPDIGKASAGTKSYVVQIPNGYYGNTYTLMMKIRDVVNTMIKSLKFKKARSITVDGGHSGPSLSIQLQNVILHVEDKHDSPWSLMGIEGDLKKTRSGIVNRDLSSFITPALLYASIVENSYINGKKSRNLGVIPLNQHDGYSFYEFKNPVYVPIEVHQFSEILLELRDLNGEYIKFDQKRNTIISLHLKSINRGD